MHDYDFPHLRNKTYNLFLFKLQADIKFQQCIREFIKLWENQLEINWESGTGFHSLSEEGPHLSLLPDEFLPSLDRQLFQLKLCIEKVKHQTLEIENFN